MENQINQQANQQGQQIVPPPEGDAALQPVESNVPGTTWNPPSGDIDFDVMFAREGRDGEHIANSNAVPVEPTTETTEPVVETKPAELERPEFYIKTEGTVYKSREDAERGVQQKDQLISQLRSMVSAVTGEDPLARSGAKPAPTSVPQKPVSYLQDSRRYAEDLQKAAELGQKTGSWDAYRNIQAQLQYEVVQSAVGPYMPVVQNVGRQQAINDVIRTNPDFRTFYNSEEYQKVLEARPKLASFISFAEQQPTMQEELKELYQSVWDARQAAKLPELVKQHQTPQNPTPRMPQQSVARPSLQVPDQQRAQVKPTTPNFSTSEGRQAIISDLRQKGIEDYVF
jgi:hypothetical protein